MIRDPSDGTVKEKQVLAKNATTEISGLPEIREKPDELIRLEKSREWLRDRKLSFDLKRGIGP